MPRDVAAVAFLGRVAAARVRATGASRKSTPRSANAAASARFINFSSNAAALAWFGWHGEVMWWLGAAMAAANVLGAQAGTLLAIRHGNRLLRSAFIVVVCILIARSSWDAWLSLGR